MEFTIETIELLLLIAALVAMVARRVRIPYTVILVFAGIALAYFFFTPEIELSRELIFTVLLPPLPAVLGSIAPPALAALTLKR